jgi:hypothetical protein
MEKLENQNKKLQEENAALKAELEKLNHYKEVAEKNEKSEETIFFTEPLKVDGEEFESLTFRRPTGRDIRQIGSAVGIGATYQLARLLCSDLNDVSDDEFDEMDWQKHLKHIVETIDVFM